MASNLRNTDSLQALVLSNDFQTTLNPIRHDVPSILMKIANIPLFEYLIRALTRSKVEELFVYCASDIDAITTYVNSRKFDDITVTLIISDGCASLGDAMRDIDIKGLIRGDFILIRGDAFVKTDLKHVMDVHKAKTKLDKGRTMTMLMRNVGSLKGSYLEKEKSIVVSNKSNKKVLFYKKLDDDKKVKMELQWFLDHGEIDINTNLLDSHVYFCSPSFIPLFSDNFDFQTMEDFIRGVLMNEEILDTRIYWYQLDLGDYSLAVTSINSYHVLSHDILRRYTYPLTPDCLYVSINYHNKPRRNYKHDAAVLGRGTTLDRDSMIGKNSSVGKNTSITKSIIGDNCVIGDDIRIEYSYIFSNVSIKNNSSIVNSILCDDCSLQDNVQLNRCILHPKVSLTENTQYDDSICILKNDELITKQLTEEGINLPCFKAHIVEESTESSDESSSESDSNEDSLVPDDTNMFYSEVIDSLLRGYQDKLKCENLILEINSSRYAYNVSIREVTFNVIKAILNLPLHYMSEMNQDVNNTTYQTTLKTMICYFNAIITNYVKNSDGEDDCLKAIEEVATTIKELIPFSKYLLHYLYDRDILCEQRILDWYSLSDGNDTDGYNKELRTVLEPFIKWLKEAEEDSSSESND